jgi:hypothetical protein
VVPKRGGAAAARETEIGKPAALRCVTPTLRYMDANVLAFSREVKVTTTVGEPSEADSTKDAHASYLHIHERNRVVSEATDQKFSEENVMMGLTTGAGSGGSSTVQPPVGGGELDGKEDPAVRRSTTNGSDLRAMPWATSAKVTPKPSFSG